MSTKCDNCSKSITKSTPGLECSKCERLVHLNTKCTGLTNKQLTALKTASPGLGWTCQECLQETSRRSSSLIVPEEDEDDDSESLTQIDVKKLSKDISAQVEKTIKKELKEVSTSLQFHSAKLDEVMISIDAFKQTIKDLERKNTDLTNKNNNLQIRVGALEQRLQNIEQEKLLTYIEIANVPCYKNGEVTSLVENIATKLKLPKEDVKQSRRLRGRNDKDGNIQVELKDENVLDQWIKAAKNTPMTVADIHPEETSNSNTVYIREKMTQQNKKILWHAKQELKIKQHYKYVWFKKGSVKACKEEKGKTYVLRTMEDVAALINKTS